MLRLILFSLLLHSPALLQADSVHLASASNFRDALAMLEPAFEEATGHELIVSTGSSGKLYAQLRHGAPFDLLLSADAARPARLEADGIGIAGSRFTYAQGRIALWSAGEVETSRGPEVLWQGEFDRLALANPELAPYGMAARDTLQSLDVLERLEARLVQGENIAQAYLFVASGNAELGFVALSQLGEAEVATAWIVPPNLHRPIEQQAILINDRPAAREFMKFLRGRRAGEIIRQAGYETVTETAHP